MKCSVLLTHERGVRLPGATVRGMSPFVGNLLVAMHEGNPQRAGLHARLAHAGPSVKADLLLPLFDVQLVKMVDAGFLLRGYEILVTEGVAQEVVQGWWCKPLPE